MPSSVPPDPFDGLTPGQAKDILYFSSAELFSRADGPGRKKDNKPSDLVHAGFDLDRALAGWVAERIAARVDPNLKSYAGFYRYCVWIVYRLTQVAGDPDPGAAYGKMARAKQLERLIEDREEHLSRLSGFITRARFSSDQDWLNRIQNDLEQFLDTPDLLVMHRATAEEMLHGLKSRRTH